MIQRDFVLRLIAEAARLVALALGLRRAGDPEEAAARLDDAARLVTGQPLDVVVALPESAHRALCTRGDVFDPLLAVALADVLAAAGHPDAARPLYRAAADAGAAVPLHALIRSAGGAGTGRESGYEGEEGPRESGRGEASPG